MASTINKVKHLVWYMVLATVIVLISASNRPQTMVKMIVASQHAPSNAREKRQLKQKSSTTEEIQGDEERAGREFDLNLPASEFDVDAPTLNFGINSLTSEDIIGASITDKKLEDLESFEKTENLRRICWSGPPLWDKGTRLGILKLHTPGFHYFLLITVKKSCSDC
ncbi:unnamed protein product [Peronospora farinosa]|uniref:RxLR effector protein n=1 Tax=Peronospora farinosa TaxID=134698 RepID=A0AAV0UAD2_9STRA|nr:unnamed protein product [Peronospora farinosa]